jgi:hypothetical protein
MIPAESKKVKLKKIINSERFMDTSSEDPKYIVTSGLRSPIEHELTTDRQSDEYLLKLIDK